MWKSCFWNSGLKINIFEKLLNSFSCISFMKLFGLSVFYINFCSFSKNPAFQNFDWSNVFFDWSKIPWFLKLGLELVRLILDWYSINRICFSIDWSHFWPIEILSDFKWYSLSGLIGTRSVLDQLCFEKKEK